MAGQMLEQIAPQITGNRNEGIARDPTRDAPEKIVGRNQRCQEDEAQPCIRRAGRVSSCGERVDQDFHRVLRANRATDGGNDGGYDRGMCDRAPPYVAGEKRKGAIAVPTSVFHSDGTLPVGLRTRHRVPATRQQAKRFPRNSPN
jgi:hypothetical protein